jgi:DNA-damage-inducible protein J
MTDCVVRSRVNPHIKAKATKIFELMGMTLSEAIRVFLYQSVTEKRIPFSINMPNAATRKALEAVNRESGLKKISLKQLTKDWNKVAI